ncbi:carbohydrate-binding protein [Agaribacterium sp. ZY112]|uniref:carbohydrate-binding protein n=1 Tax=Agaribacterium sp. ZY112 TaxID=3233574 RepID=UPI003525B144
MTSLRAIPLLMLLLVLSIGTQAATVKLGASVLSGDQCNLTSQCQAHFGPAATDCKNSQSSVSVCMCSSDTCNSLVPVIPSEVVVPGLIQAENANRFNDSDTKNAGNVYRDDALDVEASKDSRGAYNVGWIEPGEWLEYDINVKQAGKYRVDFRVSSKLGGGQFDLGVNNSVAASNLSVAATGGWQSWQTIGTELKSLQQGKQRLRVLVKQGGFNLNWIELVRTGDIEPAPVFDQCDTTNQCRTTWLDATDCKNSRSDKSVCMCGDVPCDSVIVTPPTPLPSIKPSVAPSPSPLPSVAPSQAPVLDQCNTTNQCRTTWFNATDCKNSQSAQSVCMCGTSRCDSEPTPEPSAIPSVLPSAAPSIQPSPAPTTPPSGELSCAPIEAVSFDKYKGIAGFSDAATDNKAGKSALQIAARNAIAAAQKTYNGADAEVIFKVNAMQEIDGEPTYTVKVNGKAIGSATNSRIHGTGIADYTIQTHTINDAQVSLTKGDLIQVEFNNHTNGLVPEGSLTATARGRWHSLEICSSTDTTPPVSQGDCEVSGTQAQWHRVAVTCKGLAASERNDSTFTNNRFDVSFSQGATTITVPGHFAADGNAADTSAVEGDHWRAYFAPPTTGTWNYKVSFRQGNNIAVNSDKNAGTPVQGIDGNAGSFSVGTALVDARDMRERGLLRHNKGERYLRFAGDNSIFIEAGMDSPENIFGYSEFDNTTKYDNVGSCKGILHDFSAHQNDWQSGDPSWKNGKGKSLIGVLNYIANRGVNAFYVMAMTVNGDGCDAHPWVNYSGNRKAFDVSKLDQWERVFSHATRKGLLIHFMTQETENDQLLNGGALGFERKLYYREMISRFAHHPALQWNLGEENTNTAAQQKSFADFIRANDAYGHPIFLHTFPGQHANYEKVLGHNTIDGPTIQFGGIPESATGSNGVYGKTVDWLTKSANAGNQWVVTMTEASGGDAPFPNTDVSTRQRVYWMWANVMAGGGGFEWYLKNNGTHAYDLSVENLREFDNHWKQSGYLARFFSDIVQDELGINLAAMERDNGLTSNGNDWVLSAPGEAYIVFLRKGGNTKINLSGSGTYKTTWFNPRTGEKSLGNTLTAPGNVNVGNPPSQTGQDWVVVISNEAQASLHPDIVRTISIDEADIIQVPSSAWASSYSVGDACYCTSNVDGSVASMMVNSALGTKTVEAICDELGAGPGASGRPMYNDAQCGNGPANTNTNEDYCPGRVDIGKAGCGHIGPEWKKPASQPSPNPGGTYVEKDGLVIMEAENTASSLDKWVKKTSVNGYTGSGYLEFTGNSVVSGPATSPLTYKFKVNQGGLYHLHMFIAKENVVVNGVNRTDVANDGYVRLDGDYSAGPNAGNSHGNHAPLSALQKNTKFYGGKPNQFEWASGNRLDLGGHDNKRVAIYNLKAGETYTFTLSGRSQLFKVDRIVFRHSSVGVGAAQTTSKPETL